MRTSSVWPRSNHTLPLTCRPFEAALRWTFDQHTWLAAPERHVWVFEWPHYLRAALAAEVRIVGHAQSAHAKMAQGLVVAQEDRLPQEWPSASVTSYSARSALAHAGQHGRVVRIPFYSPSYFMYPIMGSMSGEHADELLVKDMLAAESSGHSITCHRFDLGPRQGRWSCLDAAMVDPKVTPALSHPRPTRSFRWSHTGIERVSAFGGAEAAPRPLGSDRFCWCTISVSGIYAATPHLTTDSAHPVTCAQCIRRGLSQAADLLNRDHVVSNHSTSSHGLAPGSASLLLNRQNESALASARNDAVAPSHVHIHRLSHRSTAALRRKAQLYLRSTFCLVPPGDTLVTPRIFSFTAAACIPVFTYPLHYLPFGRLVPWARLSLSVDPHDVVDFCKANKAREVTADMLRRAVEAGASANVSALQMQLAQMHPRNPLEFLVTLAPSRVRQMQRALLRFRHLLHFEDDRGGGALILPSARHATATHALALELVHQVLPEGRKLDRGFAAEY